MAEAEASEFSSFGNAVQRRRMALGLTRSALAHAVGCAPVTIKKIERDERRPSTQIAELLADHLRIPTTTRAAFLHMARGELASVLAPSGMHTLPLPAAYQTPPALSTSEDFPFVARAAELARLDSTLAQALRGQGQVVFIAGEAGCGKSVLAQEFARRSQAAHPTLVVATGHCNAYTGAGDPYLPFREILNLLTGDLEFYAAASNLPPARAQRLWQVMPFTLQALVEMGRDLLDTFIPTRQLLNRLAATIYAGGDALAPYHQRLTALAERAESMPHPANTQQSALFEQYTRVLLTVARHMPLLLILDDLQWADAGSINLLFHLGRHLTGGQLLIVGIYRPTDVALGRNGKRHPLEPLINELQRYSGNNQIDLNSGASNEGEGRHFVDALLDAQPNRFDAAFRASLLAQTEGHALFTVEMLRGLQEQGDVIKDAQGRWVATAQLTWGNLPSRVEGIIRERLGRLSPALQATLKVASVEGELFTAEVVAGVQGIAPRVLIGDLSDVLERQQDLVRAVGVRTVSLRPVEEGQQGARPTRTLAQYRFRHILFQRFLYESLDEVERVYLHQAVGQEMEQLYAGQADVAALQLARHFAIAGDETRALAYLVTAGDVAAAADANIEAIVHYQRAAEITRRMTVANATVLHLYLRLGRVLELTSQFSAALATYEELNQLARTRGDRQMQLSAITAQSTLYSTLTPLYDAVRGQTLLEEALLLAYETGDQPAEAKILRNLATLHLYAARTEQGILYGEQALALARTLDLREQMAFALNDLGLSYFSICRFPEAEAALSEVHKLWRELGNMPMLADSLSTACNLNLYAGYYEQSVACAEEAYKISQTVGNLWGQSYSHSMVGLAYWQLGRPDLAITVIEDSIRLADLADFGVPHAFTRADQALVLAGLGAIDEGVRLAQAAVMVAERQVPVFRAHVLSKMAQVHILQGDLIAAQGCIERANAGDMAKPVVFFYATRLIEAEVRWRCEDYEFAMSRLEELVPIFRNAGLRMYLLRALYVHAGVYRALGLRAAAEASLQEARVVALTTNSRIDLWPILMSLRELESDPMAAEALRAEAQTVVEEIASHTPTAELRASFLALPQVQRVFASSSG